MLIDTSSGIYLSGLIKMNRKHKIFVRTSLIRGESEINWARWELVSDNASCSVQSTCNINLQHVINTEYSNANQVDCNLCSIFCQIIIS